MLKRILFALVIPSSLLGGCVLKQRRPAVTSPRYIAQCPPGYRFDGKVCHRYDVGRGAAEGYYYPRPRY